MNKGIVDDVMKVRGVRGAAVLAPPGTIANSTIKQKELNDFFELLFKTAFDGKSASALGAVKRVVVRTDKDEDLSLLIKDKEALAIVSERSRPQNELFAEVSELLQKG